MHSWRAVQSKSYVWTCDRNVSCSCLLLSGIQIFRPLREICVPPCCCWTVERELCVHWPWRWSIEDLNCRAIESCYKRMRGSYQISFKTILIHFFSITISNKSLFHYINISIDFVRTAEGFTQRRSINFADTYELPAPESISTRHLIPLTSTTRTGNDPSPTWFVVKATPVVGVGWLVSCLGASQMDVWWCLWHCWQTDLLGQKAASTSICIWFSSLLRDHRVDKCLLIASDFPVSTMVFVLPMLILSCVTLISRFASVASISAIFTRAENQDLNYTHNSCPCPCPCPCPSPSCRRCHVS